MEAEQTGSDTQREDRGIATLRIRIGGYDRKGGLVVPTRDLSVEFSSRAEAGRVRQIGIRAFERECVPAEVRASAVFEIDFQPIVGLEDPDELMLWLVNAALVDHERAAPRLRIVK